MKNRMHLQIGNSLKLSLGSAFYKLLIFGFL